MNNGHTHILLIEDNPGDAPTQFAFGWSRATSQPASAV
jgi:hypothetical protein